MHVSNFNIELIMISLTMNIAVITNIIIMFYDFYVVNSHRTKIYLYDFVSVFINIHYNELGSL